MHQKIVTELIQSDLNTETLVIELTEILEGESRSKMLNSFQELREKLGGKGASDEAAAIIVKG